MPETSFLFFGGAAREPLPCAGDVWTRGLLPGVCLLRPRRRKTKRRVRFAVCTINRPPLAGFEEPAFLESFERTTHLGICFSKLSLFKVSVISRSGNLRYVERAQSR